MDEFAIIFNYEIWQNNEVQNILPSSPFLAYPKKSIDPLTTVAVFSSVAVK